MIPASKDCWDTNQSSLTKMPSQATRACIVRLHQGGMTNQQIRAALPQKNLCQQSVAYVIKVHGRKGSGASFKDQTRSGKPQTVRTPTKIKEVHKEILENPQKTFAELARKHRCGRRFSAPPMVLNESKQRELWAQFVGASSLLSTTGFFLRQRDGQEKENWGLLPEHLQAFLRLEPNSY